MNRSVNDEQVWPARNPHRKTGNDSNARTSISVFIGGDIFFLKEQTPEGGGGGSEDDLRSAKIAYFEIKCTMTVIQNEIPLNFNIYK